MNSISHFKKERLNEYFIFMDALRETGKVNMLGASPYLISCFPELNRQNAKDIIMLWIDNLEGSEK